MSAHVTVAEVQQWLETSKLDLSGSFDLDLEASAAELVLSRLRAGYATDTWVDESTTPTLVRMIIAMFVAGWTYDRSFSEQGTETTSYGKQLESAAMDLLGGLVAGSSILSEGSLERDATSYPAFWPTDAATQIAEDEGSDADGAAVRWARAGMQF